MRWKKTLQLAEVHCEGEIGKVITGGVLGIPGATMLDKMNHINRVDDSLRRLVTLEPRGCLQMSVNLLLPPTRPEAHAGFIVLQADKAHPMSGSNCICWSWACCRCTNRKPPSCSTPRPAWSPPAHAAPTGAA